MPAFRRNRQSHIAWNDAHIATALRCLDQEQEARFDSERPDIWRADSRQNRSTQRVHLNGRMTQIQFEGASCLWVVRGDLAVARRFRDALHSTPCPENAYQMVFGEDPEEGHDEANPQEGDSWAAWWHRLQVQYISEQVTLELPAFCGVNEGDNGVNFRAIITYCKANPEERGDYQVDQPSEHAPASAQRKILA